ncbi:MAG: S8 family serine peptidase [Bacteroidales bacterium]|nr:S8 family serine peptidase [Bacteroidales bacterium]
MKYRPLSLFTLLLLLLVSMPLSVDARTALDAYSRHTLKLASASSRSAENQTIGAIVSGYPDTDIEGLNISPLSNDIYIARGSAESLARLAQSAGVRRVSFSRPLRTTNDLLRIGMEADKAASLPEAGGYTYTGHGVVAGLYDNGLDIKNPAFRNADGSRVSRLWHFTDTNGEYTAYDYPLMIESFITDNYDDFHGTHVLGTMAGDYPGSPYKGIATGAELAVACGLLHDANIAEGVARIASYARSEGKPCVINLSIADLDGPRDGTDAFAEALYEATAAAGDAILVVSAGNYRNLKTSLSRTLSASDPALRTFMLPSMTEHKSEGVITVWGADSRTFDLTLVVMDTTTGTVLSTFDVPKDGDGLILGTHNLQDFDDYDVVRDDAFSQAYTGSFAAAYYDANTETNKRASFQIFYDVKVNLEQNRYSRTALGLIAKGEAGQRIDIHISDLAAELRSLWVDGWTEGTGELSISSMACTRGAISVGAWVTRNQWDELNGDHDDLSDTHILGDIAPWSSSGILCDGTPKPDVAAPGATIISTLSTPYCEEHPESVLITGTSRSEGRTDYWGWSYGTSMASPAVAGAIAIWLEADPNLEATDILDIIAKTSAKDTFTEASPLEFGAGKLDIAAGLREVLSRKASLIGPSAVIPGRLVLTRGDHDRLTAEIGGVSDFEATLYDLSGRALATALTTDGIAEFDTSALARGVYIVRAGSDTAKIKL